MNSIPEPSFKQTRGCFRDEDKALAIPKLYYIFVKLIITNGCARH